MCEREGRVVGRPVGNFIRQSDITASSVRGQITMKVEETIYLCNEETLCYFTTKHM